MSPVTLLGTPYSFGGNCSGCSASILRVRVDYEEEGGMDEQVNGRMQLEVNPTKLEAKEELEVAGQDHDTEREEVEFEKSGVTLPGKEIEGNKYDMPENVYAVSGVLSRDGIGRIAYPGDDNGHGQQTSRLSPCFVKTKSISARCKQVNNLPLAPQQAPSGDLMVFFMPYRLTKARVFKEADDCVYSAPLGWRVGGEGSFEILSTYGVPASTSTAATTSSSSAAAQTSSSLVVASSSGATSTVSTAVASAPKLPSEITGKTVEEIIKEWNSELQERTGKFRKQANAIAEWDKKILRNRDVLLRLESEVAKVVETQSSLERQLELIETHQQEVDKALQSMEEEAEQIYKDERRLLLDDEAASTRDAMYEQAEIIERELEQMTEQIKQIIQTLNANQAGEFEAIDGMTPLDVVVRILNNQLSSLMWIDEKAEEFSSRIQKLASQGSAADREMMGPKLWLS
ncbi:hypothetical protein RJ640_020547 [Escallonia rubra]|uniref:Nucleoporin NSP1-like C-terminal domain-containing protein n=1 Tax=Escallonia rubra TaxID=112253 RepID=A0AA88UQ81_9ASTE|nr:hypothetical protein RJ640_020547 [Escallonia rubra]